MTNDEAKQREAALRGEKAKYILESELWLEAWATYEGRILEDFKSCKSNDTDRMQQLKMLHLAGVAAKSHLERLIEDGKFAKADLAFKEKQKPTLLQRLRIA